MLKNGLVTNNPLLKFLFRYKSPKQRFVKAGTSSSSKELSAQKQAAIESLCAKLFQKQDLVMSGKLQLLGLAKIKKRMGRRWKGMQKVVYEICDEAMKKYITEGDLFLRYCDDSYLLLFGTASLPEIELRVHMIAQEIKQQLFERTGIDDIDIVPKVSALNRQNMSRAGMTFPEAIEQAFEMPPQELVFEEPKMALPVNRTEIDAFADPERKISDLDLGVEEEALAQIGVQYLPVWDQYKKRLVSYMCLPAYFQADHGNLVGAYTKFARKLSATQKAGMDMGVLSRVTEWLADRADDPIAFGIICPVQYDTLVGADSRERYKKICQQIDAHMKQYILFMVMDVPRAPWVSLSQVISPLKTYGRVLCAEMSLEDQIDFESLRMSGFDHVGIVFKSPEGEGGIRKMLSDVRMFVTRARKHMIHKTFVLDVDDPVTAKNVAHSGVRFMAGGAIFKSITEPRNHLDFYRNPTFTAWQKASDKARSTG